MSWKLLCWTHNHCWTHSLYYDNSTFLFGFDLHYQRSNWCLKKVPICIYISICLYAHFYFRVCHVIFAISLLIWLRPLFTFNHFQFLILPLSVIRAWFCIQSLEHCQYLPIPNLPKLSSKLVSPWSFPHLRWENTIYLFLCVYFLCYWGYTLFPWCLKNKFPTGCLFLKNLICSLIPGYKVKPN